MPTFEHISVDQFKKAAGQFFRATEDVNEVGLGSTENGHKCLALMYFGHEDDWSEREIYEAVIVLELAGKRLMEVEQAHMLYMLTSDPN